MWTTRQNFLKAWIKYKSYHKKAFIQAYQGIKWEAWISISSIKRDSDFCEARDSLLSYLCFLFLPAPYMFPQFKRNAIFQEINFS